MSAFGNDAERAKLLAPFIAWTQLGDGGLTLLNDVDRRRRK
jgi:hypothetical protein